jgi:DNA-binding XRE family transcriptional regulator
MVLLNGNSGPGQYTYGMARNKQQTAERRRQAQAQAQVTPNFKTGQQRNFFRQWRKYRKMTLEEAGEAAGMTAGNISAMERGAQGYTESGLQALAEAYGCLPGQLLMVDPINSDIWSIWELAKTGLPNQEPGPNKKK